MNASTITVYFRIYLVCILDKSLSRTYACVEFSTFLAESQGFANFLSILKL